MEKGRLVWNQIRSFSFSQDFLDNSGFTNMTMSLEAARQRIEEDRRAFIAGLITTPSPFRNWIVLNEDDDDHIPNAPDVKGDEMLQSTELSSPSTIEESDHGVCTPQDENHTAQDEVHDNGEGNVDDPAENVNQQIHALAKANEETTSCDEDSIDERIVPIQHLEPQFCTITSEKKDKDNDGNHAQNPVSMISHNPTVGCKQDETCNKEEEHNVDDHDQMSEQNSEDMVNENENASKDADGEESCTEQGMESQVGNFYGNIVRPRRWAKLPLVALLVMVHVVFFFCFF